MTRRLSQTTVVAGGQGTLQAAYDGANAGDVLVLQAGDYTGSLNADAVLVIDKGVLCNPHSRSLLT